MLKQVETNALGLSLSYACSMLVLHSVNVLTAFSRNRHPVALALGTHPRSQAVRRTSPTLLASIIRRLVISFGTLMQSD
jgi:hypothetical protein